MVNIAPYNPQKDGQIEWPNKTIKRLMKLLQQSDSTLSHREALDLALKQYNGQKHSTIEMPPLLAEKLTLSSEGFQIAGFTTSFEEKWNKTTYDDRKTKVDSLIKIQLEKFATHMVEKFNAKWPILQFSVGKIVRVRAPTWRQRKKGNLYDHIKQKF